jgi:HlyD family secretion protein
MKTAGRRRLWVWGGIGVIVVGALVVAMLPRPVEVDTAVVDRGHLAVTLDHEGRTRVHDRYIVSAPLAGRVLRIELRPGDPVRAGDTVLATLVPAEPALLDARSLAEGESRVRAAEAALARVRAEQELAQVAARFAESESRRIRALADQGVASAQQRDSAEAEARARARALDAAVAAVDLAVRDVETARAALVQPARTIRWDSASGQRVLSLRSPIDGVVLQRFQESEAAVSQGQPLVEVADLSTIEVIADFLSADAVRIRAGMPVLIEQWGGGTALNGRVARVEPSGFLKISALGVEEQRVWVVIAFDDPRGAWEALGDGYRLETRVIVWERADILRVPTSSIFREGADWAAFVVESGRARARRLRIGERNGTAAEVVEGLKAGDRVVVHPSDRVADGVRVAERGR